MRWLGGRAGGWLCGSARARAGGVWEMRAASGVQRGSEGICSGGPGGGMQGSGAWGGRN